MKTEPSLRVLHVEDNPGDARLLTEALHESRLDLTIDSAPNGVRAIEYLHQVAHGDRPIPDVILLDLNMPVMDGMTFLRVRTRHEDWRRIPVIVLSSSRRQEDVAEAKELGAVLYVVKPVTYDEYLSLARRLSRFPHLDPTPPRGEPTLASRH